MAEKEYIEREAVLDYIDKRIPKLIASTDGKHIVYVEAIRDVIVKFPAADVAPVRHGEWQEINGIFSCSHCGYSFEHEGYIPFFNYCPNCGAKLC